jgi:hypothetical protein
MINHLMGFFVVNTFFAIVSRITPYCASFDMARYKAEVYYIFLPHGITHMKVIYLVMGIILPIVVQVYLEKIKGQLKKKGLKQEKFLIANRRILNIHENLE